MNDTFAFDSADRDFGVLVGFDGSDHARSALHFAAAEALSSGAALTVVTVYRLPPMMYTGEPAILVTPEARAERDPADLLEAKTRTAQLTVVGTRGRGGMKSTLLGSVSRELLNRARGPVMVVPTERAAQ